MPGMGMMGLGAGAPRQARSEGDISSVFASLSGEEAKPLPPRFIDLKRQIIGDEANQRALTDSWVRLCDRLGQAGEEIERKKQDCIPQIAYEELTSPSPSTSTLSALKRAGSFVVRGVVDEETATGWLKGCEKYIGDNPQVRGFPKDDKQVFELYWSKTQLAARSHPRSLAVQRSLLTLFTHPPDFPISLTTPLTYADRLRIRHPGDAQFALGPHMDGGSIERWEDPMYRAVYKDILNGNWEAFDAYTIGERGVAKQNLYDGPGSCGVFRAFQGWTSMSETGPGEGTLRVYPFIRELTAYTILRPLFREKESRASLTYEQYLDPSNWVLDPTTSAFPGSPLARSQEFNDVTHPHLALNRSMVSMPTVKPGDQAWWHCESVHNGTGPSAVLYIPAVPLTPSNIEYIKDQRSTFFEGRPGPDFPGGEGEAHFVGKGVEGDILSKEGRRAMGLEPFEITADLSSGEKSIRQKA
ncbi:hypothetical protein I316_03757 [Kwoniella heveanensis BCC8398]|uniref:DUF1479-domain-containing protein n=1 Tax=Kwoniella heveanensis BCC8398 TaxID=1296120 RepID=A0A1B9GUJ5_9TREE|nr:hypothetical protein I316_03757 [Kwoniella heveanensis BCC8398]